MGNYKFLIVGVIAALTGISIAIFGVLTMGNFSQETYSISVDPTKEKQTLFIMARVSIQNTGSGALTNVQINYGEGDKDYLVMLFHHSHALKQYFHKNNHVQCTQSEAFSFF